MQTLCLAKLNATLPEEEIQSCYYLKDGNIKLTLANLSLTSAFNKMVKNPDAEREKTNLYFNFMLTRRRNGVPYEIRKKVVGNTCHNNEVTAKYMDKRRFTIDQNWAEVLLQKEIMV